MTGPYAGAYWFLITCNIVAPQVLWFKTRAQQRRCCCSSASIVVLVGMWLERFVIIVSSLAQDFLPSSWGISTPRAGTGPPMSAPSDCSLFLFFLFIRLLPMISIFEVRTLLPQAKVEEEARS